VTLVALFLLREDSANAAHVSRDGLHILAAEIQKMSGAPSSAEPAKPSPDPIKPLQRRSSGSVFLSCLRSAAESPGKQSRKSVAQLQALLEGVEPSWWLSTSEVTSPAVALECLQLLSSYRRLGGEGSVTDDCRHCGVIESLHGALLSSSEAVLAAAPGSCWAADKGLVHCVENCARVLENLTLLNRDNQECALRLGLLRLLIQLAGSCQSLLEAGSGTADSQAVWRLLSALLRAAMNMTEGNERAALLCAENDGIDTVVRAHLLLKFLPHLVGPLAG
jgi:hypothetical protein